MTQFLINRGAELVDLAFRSYKNDNRNVGQFVELDFAENEETGYLGVVYQDSQGLY